MRDLLRAGEKEGTGESFLLRRKNYDRACRGAQHLSLFNKGKRMSHLKLEQQYETEIYVSDKECLCITEFCIVRKAKH